MEFGGKLDLVDRLSKLRDADALTDEDFARAKASILGGELRYGGPSHEQTADSQSVEMLERLTAMWKSGALTGDEFEREKTNILDASETSNGAAHDLTPRETRNERLWGRADGRFGKLSPYIRAAGVGLAVIGVVIGLQSAQSVLSFPELGVLGWTDRTKTLDTDTEVQKALKAHYAESIQKNDAMAQCLGAGLIEQTYANDNDARNVQFWDQKLGSACKAAGLPLDQLGELAREDRQIHGDGD